MAQVQARKAAGISLWSATTKLEELVSELTDMEDELDAVAGVAEDALDLLDSEGLLD